MDLKSQNQKSFSNKCSKTVFINYFHFDCNWTRTQNHLVLKRTLNRSTKLAKWLSCVLSTYLYGAFDCMFLLCHVRVSHSIVAWMSRNSLIEAGAKSEGEVKEFLDIQATIECGFIHDKNIQYFPFLRYQLNFCRNDMQHMRFLYKNILVVNYERCIL